MMAQDKEDDLSVPWKQFKTSLKAIQGFQERLEELRELARLLNKCAVGFVYSKGEQNRIHDLWARNITKEDGPTHFENETGFKRPGDPNAF